MLPPGVCRAVEGCSHVIHTASPLPTAAPKDPEAEVIRPAVDGTLAVLRACHRHRVSRVVITSSIAAVAGDLSGGQRALSVPAGIIVT